MLGSSLACSGEPFTASANSGDSRVSTSTAGGGGQSSPPGTVDDTAAGGPSVPGEPSGTGGTTATEPPETGGVGGTLDGSPAGGEGGAATAPECPSGAVDEWELGYFPELREAATQESHPFFKVTNRGQPTTLNRLQVRYYFTKESDMPETAVCYWVTGDRCALAKMAFVDLPVPTENATRYLQVSFPEATNVTVATESLEVRVGFKTGSALLTQTNDYSFDASAAAPSEAAPFPYKRWLRTTLYLDGELVWGTEPCASRGAPSTSHGGR